MATMVETAPLKHSWLAHFDEPPTAAEPRAPSPTRAVKAPSSTSKPADAAEPAQPLKPLSNPWDIDELLKEPITFVPASAVLSIESTKYTPINEVRPASSAPLARAAATSSPVASTSAVPYGTAGPTDDRIVPSSALTLEARWPQGCHQPAMGLYNDGNTCFLNSALQALMHTPPLVQALLDDRAHPVATCKNRAKGYCALCAARDLVQVAYVRKPKGYHRPKAFYDNLRRFSKTLVPGRQEDSHEFLRVCVDAMMNAELVGANPKQAALLRDQTIAHRVFGGRFRSRVQCLRCRHPSDTFDHFMDLSLDVRNTPTVERALESFRRVDRLRHPNQYKCEKCKKLVDADKTFAIEEAPLALTIHFKRFDAGGRKITEMVRYPARLDLGPAMCDTSERPTYQLYGVVCHSGGGVRSGHYVAYVRAANSQWYRMDDEIVTSTSQGDALSQRNAYMLFYIKQGEDRLAAAVAQATAPRPPSAQPARLPLNGIPSFNNKRKAVDEASDDIGEAMPSPAKKPFGPQLPDRPREMAPPPPTSSSSAYPAASSSSSPQTAFPASYNRFKPLDESSPRQPMTSSDAATGAAPVNSFYKNTAGPSSKPFDRRNSFKQPSSSSSSNAGYGGGGYGGGQYRYSNGNGKRGGGFGGGGGGRPQQPTHAKGMAKMMRGK